MTNLESRVVRLEMAAKAAEEIGESKAWVGGNHSAVP